MAIGFCKCGCGQPTRPYRQSHTALGVKKGDPQPYVNGAHAKRKSPPGVLPSGALFDECDRALVESQSWYVDTQGYLAGWKDGLVVRLHRLILKVSPGQVADHINRNRLDNRRDNLRSVTQLVNAQNSGVSRRSKSGIKSVYYYPGGAHCKEDRYVAQVTRQGKTDHLGTFASLAAAESALQAWQVRRAEAEVSA